MKNLLEIQNEKVWYAVEMPGHQQRPIHISGLKHKNDVHIGLERPSIFSEVVSGITSLNRQENIIPTLGLNYPIFEDHHFLFLDVDFLWRTDLSRNGRFRVLETFSEYARENNIPCFYSKSMSGLHLIHRVSLDQQKYLETCDLTGLARLDSSNFYPPALSVNPIFSHGLGSDNIILTGIAAYPGATVMEIPWLETGELLKFLSSKIT